MRFLADDAGAVTIDWVTLTAGVLLAGIMAIYAIFDDGVDALVSNVDDTARSMSQSASLASVSIDGGSSASSD